jgi:arylsulfatase A-like enzyme
MAALAGSMLPAQGMRAQAPRPNIVHILADDLGWGAVGFNGQTLIQTPNIDTLANAGMRLLNAYSCPTCAASRASLLTGFHQGHSSVDGNDELDVGFTAADTMTPQVLAPAGYTSGVFGKWGFGATGTRNLGSSDPLPTITGPSSLPNSHGFDEFYGYLSHAAAQDYFYSWMWKTQSGAPNGVTTEANNGGPGGAAQYTHDLIADRSEQFVAAHAGNADPFYVQVSYTIPHWDIDSIASAPGGYGIYAGQAGWTSQQKAYAAMITRMDASIGSLIERLRDPNDDGNESDSILENTLVIFSSDNGPTAEDASPVDFFNANGNLRGGKFEAYEGGIHMPSFAYWPGSVAAGSSTAYRTDMADFMATAADLAGVATPVGIDGTSIAPILTGQGRMRERDYLIVEQQGGRPASGADPDPRTTRWTIIRQDGMKLIRYDNETSEVFNLNSDPDESSPLNMSIPANAQLRDELEALAIAEGVTRGVAQFRTWNGASGGNVQDDSNWDGVGPPNGFWSATIANADPSARIAHVSADVTTLGLEIRGQSAAQVVDVHSGKTLTGRNEVRIKANGRVELSDGTLESKRWVDVKPGGEIRGQGTVKGDVYNEGVLAPGRPSDSQSWPITTPPALPPANLDTSNALTVAFDFNGVQDDVPLFATSTQSPYVQVTSGLDWGPSTGPRWASGGSNAGNELNHIGHGKSSLSAAITDGDYISFTVDAVNGAGFIPSAVSFRLWRNGAAAGKDFAILSSIGGFNAGAPVVLAQDTFTDTGAANQHTLTAAIPPSEAITGPIEFRLYGWNGTVQTGNTHINLASLSGRFVAAPTLEFNFAGVQDAAPLTALKRSDDFLMLAGGLDFGPGVAPRGASNAGNEFHVAGFSTESTLDSALAGGDYLTFAVQSVPGTAMYADSVSFTLWRQSSGSATDYAVFSSVDGFTAGQQLAQATHNLVGNGNKLTLSGAITGAQPTTDPVEFRLYGWNAATSVDSTHVIAASMRARYASVAGAPIDPTGTLTVQGDLYHLLGGEIAIDLGGTTAGVDYDTLNVVGKVELEGDLDVSLAEIAGSPYSPAMGESFTILTATQGIVGQFDQVTLPLLSMGLDWSVDYQPSVVTLSVMASADFNRDGTVDAADYVVWRKNGGTQAQFNLWRANFGTTVGSGSATHADSSTGTTVPEPASALMLIVGIAVGTWTWRPVSSSMQSTR